MFEFVTKPTIMLEGIRRLGLRGAVTHGIRHVSTAAGTALLGPFQIRINPTDNLCNHACPMCFLQHMDAEQLRAEIKRERNEWMRSSDYERLFDSMPPGLSEVNIVGGGEPLAHPDIVDIMSAIRARNLRGYLMTNGTLMKEPIARAMIDMRWTRARCSVHAGTPEIYRAIHGVDKFEILKRNMLNYHRLRVEAGVREHCMLSIVNVLQRENIDDIGNMFAFAEEVGVDYVEFDLIVPLASHQMLSVEELRRIEDNIRRYSKAHAVEHNLHRLLHKAEKDQARGRNDEFYRPANRCSVGYDSAFIRATGEVLPCCFSTEVMGSLREQTFRDIWFGDKYSEFRKRLMNGCFAEYCSTNRCKYETFLHD